MKFMEAFLLSMVIAGTTCSLPKEWMQRRQLSYTNNVIHENPMYPHDQAPQSTVNVNFAPEQVEQKLTHFPQEYQHYPSQPSQSQLFNVGYSVKFTNGQLEGKTISPKFPRNPNFDNGEIITGTRKSNEQVQRPNESQDFVLGKRQKISGIKPKIRFTPSFQNSKILAQANPAPSTQKYYKILEQPQNVQEIQNNYSWRNLSPGVEIIRSTEVPIVSDQYSASNHQFDHVKALGRSQDFDYSNAVDGGVKDIYTPVDPSNLPPITKVLPQNAVQKNNLYQFPADTSLLREPVQVDTRLLDEAVKQYQNTKLYAQEQYQTIPDAAYFQDYQAEPSRNQFKIYGKPQPLPQAQRQPRYVPDLQTNLRPPPITSFQRRVITG